MTPAPPVQTVTSGDRQHVAAVLGRHFALAEEPGVSFMRDSTHLNIQLGADGASNLPDSAFEARARAITSVALRAYDKPALIDSVTVAVVEVVIPNAVVRIKRMRTFPAAIFRP